MVAGLSDGRGRSSQAICYRLTMVRRNGSVASGHGQPAEQTKGSVMSKYPNVEVDLVGENGNAYVLIAKVNKALRNAGVPRAERDEFMKEATSGDYDNVLGTIMKWVEVS
jgi:hypothetical protein